MSNYLETNELHLEAIRDNIVRVRISPPSAAPDSLLNRYGFIANAESSPTKIASSRQEDETGISFLTDHLSLRLDRNTGVLEVTDRIRQRQVLRQLNVSTGDLGQAIFAADPDEDWLGFGDQTRERLYHRGQLIDLWVRNVKSYIPVPFFMSTRGVGILVNTTNHLRFDMAATTAERFSWEDKRGVVDYYIMVGEDFRALLDAYTELTGRPKLPPVWAFGLWYICRDHANDYEAVNDAVNFRRENIPCDVIGLEPGWMEECYDRSINKQWSKSRFPIPAYCQNGPHNFINAIRRMGYHFELWLCNEYDLTFEEERRIGRGVGENSVADADDVFHDQAEEDEHFESRSPDGLTDPEISWFEHLKPFIDQGADFFKQDGAFQICNHHGRYWGNGHLDAAVHNLYPLLYSRQMHEGFEAYTNRRALVFTVAGWSGFQAWCGTWTGDTGGGLDTLGGMLNTSLTGHSWATNDMEVAEPEGIHFGYLQPWSQINSWNYFRMPWVQGKALCDMHREYGQLRARLIPYLYTWAHHATKTGYPVMAPLTLDTPDDPACRNILHEYFLGRDLLVTIYKKEVYFPRGQWKDFWTGEISTGGATKTIDWPDTRGGGLFLRNGAIVPLGPLMQYRGEKPVTEIELWIVPDDQESSLDFYEDDGTSLAHREGKFTITPIRVSSTEEEVQIQIDAPRGGYAGQVEQRTWSFRVALDIEPQNICVNGNELPQEAWHFDTNLNILEIAALAGEITLEITV